MKRKLNRNPISSANRSSVNELLQQSKTIVIIGCSSKPYRTSHLISGYLAENGYKIIPVNPNEKEVHGLECYPSIFDVPPDLRVDIIDIFRNKKYTYGQVKELVEWAESSGQKPAIWTQLDVSTPEAKELAEENGFFYIENKCIMVEHRLGE